MIEIFILNQSNRGVIIPLRFRRTPLFFSKKNIIQLAKKSHIGFNIKSRWKGSQYTYNTISLEDNTHRFIKCSITCISWKHLSNIWQVLTHCYLRPQQSWVFSQYVQNGPTDEPEILFQNLQYWELQHNWNMRNALMFDSWHEEVQREHVGIISSKCRFRFSSGITICPSSYIG